MLRIIVWTILLVLFPPAADTVHAQVMDEPPAEGISNHLNQLQKCREGLVDPNARPEERKRWAELLFSYNSPQAKALIVELLGAPQNPDVQRALCGVLADRARRRPEQMDEELVDQLMELLGVEADDLRAMAAGVLADFPGADVPAKLGKLAAEREAPLAKRLAAIDALAPNTHRREVVAQLIALLDSDSPEITERVVGALESATPQTFGSDLKRWREWWMEKAKLSEEGWLAEQLEIYRNRSRRLTDEFARFREASERERAAVTSRIRRFQREIFRTTGEERQDAQLVEWLDDPLPVVKLTALSIIKARIADEGRRPEGQVLTALLEALREGSPAVRREVLEILQNLNEPVVVDAVLAQLERENDPATRYAIFKAIGKLDRPQAIPALVREITSHKSPAQCVREAAIALGKVAAKAEGEKDLKEAVEVLKGRYRLVPAEDRMMRAALLTAMAGMADGAFAPEFLEAVDSEDAAILQPAIRGLLAIQETSKLPRLRTLMAHPDALVRLAATEAVGELGREDADLERLLTRLDPATEANELAREAAWRGFRRFLSRRSIGDRIEAAKRLRDLPQLEVKYLNELVDALPATDDAAMHRDALLDRLASVLVAQHRYAEALPVLRGLCDSRSEGTGKAALECGLRLLDAMLRSPTAPGRLSHFITQLATQGETTAKAKILDLISTYLESEEMIADTEGTQDLLAELRTVPGNVMGEEWTQLLERVAKRLESRTKEPAPTLPPGP